MLNRQFNNREQQLLAEIMACRRDVRGNNFLPSPVNPNILDEILAAAQMAPSVGYSQPWEFVVITDDVIKEKITKNYLHENQQAKQKFPDEKQRQYEQLKLEGIKEAPVNIAVFYKPTSEPTIGQNSMPEMGEYSVVCAVQNIWLMARSLNVGVGWVSILNPEEVKTVLHAPPENKLVAYLCLGYVKEFLDKPELELAKWREKQVLSIIKEKYDYNAVSADSFQTIG